MEAISLHYGNQQISLRIPQENLAGVITPRHSAATLASSDDLVAKAIKPRATEFSNIVNGRILGILLPDGTRDLPLEIILPKLLPICQTAANVFFFICTGTHNAETPENHKIAESIHFHSAKVGISHYEIVVHDCQTAAFASTGVTSRGTQVRYNKRLLQPDCFLAISDVKHHYFAGYSNPIKNIVPGLCAFETTEQNHSWTMGSRSRAGVHPWHSNPALHDNPLACDQLEAMETIIAVRPFYSLVTISSGGAIQWTDFGKAQSVAARAFDQTDAWNSFMVEPVSKMIVSPGGLPNDVDLYIAQRALELTHEAVCDNGEILFISACPNGVGSERTREQFYDKLIKPLDTIAAVGQTDYKLFSHKPWRFAQLIKRLSRLWFHSEIEASVIEKMHMLPCPNPQAVLDDWIIRNPQEKVLIVDGANKLLLRKGNLRMKN